MWSNRKTKITSRFQSDKLFRTARLVLDRLEAAGYNAYIVGGSIRDVFLGRPVHDVDIATAATPREVMALFPEAIPTGARYGTVRVRLNGCQFEVTTFRSEGLYRDGRRPETVTFVKDVTVDLSRRDFTINALACDRHGTVIDPFGGANDLRKGIIRAVGTAQNRFREDALRILRAVRLAAQLDFTIDGETLTAMKQEGANLGKLAVERVKDEFDKLLTAPKPGSALLYLWTAKLIRHMAPLSAGVPSDPPSSHLLSRIDRERDLPLRWILFLTLAGVEVEQAKRVLQAFKMSHRERDELMVIWKEGARGDWGQFTWKQLRERVFSLGLSRLVKGVRLARYFGRLPAKKERLIVWQLRHADWELPVEHPAQLALNGKQLAGIANRPSGPWIGRVKDALLNKVVRGDVINDPNELERVWRTNGPFAP